MRMGSFRIPVHTLGFAALILLISGLQFIPAKAIADEFAKSASTIDGRFNSNCPRRSANTDVCMVPFPRLIAEPERFDGKYIMLVGFLATSRGVTALFPNSESAKHFLPLESVNVGPIPSDLHAYLKQGIWVVVVGKFDAKFDGPMMSVGAIWKALDVSPYEDQKTLPPSLPPFLTPKPPASIPPSLK